VVAGWGVTDDQRFGILLAEPLLRRPVTELALYEVDRDGECVLRSLPIDH
jgi:hypothetical protein